MRCNGLCGFCQFNCSTEVITEVNEKFSIDSIDKNDEPEAESKDVVDVEATSEMAVVKAVPHYEVKRGLFGQYIAKEKK